MSGQEDSKDALIQKLDNLIRSGRAGKRQDPPPVLTDAIPETDQNAIPTLTDVVHAPEAPPAEAEAAGNAAANVQDDAPLEFEPAAPVEGKDDEPLEFERIELDDTTQEKAEDLAPVAEKSAAQVEQAVPVEEAEQAAVEQTMPEEPADVAESISSRLLGVLDQEMSRLLSELPGEESKLSVLHRSLRFALPELVRLRWLEPEDGDADDAGDDDTESET
jgi:hypothetical protein